MLNRIRRVVIPYLIACFIFVLYFHISCMQTFSLLSWGKNIFTGKLNSHFYFVIVICQFYLLMPLWRRIVSKQNLMLALPVSLLVMILCKLYLPGVITLVSGTDFLYNDRLFTTYLFYFLAGCFCGSVYDRFTLFLRTNFGSLLTGFIITGLVNCLFMALHGVGIYRAPWLELFHILYCIYAILFTLSLALKWQNLTFWKTALFRAWDKHAYLVYLLHPLAIFLCNDTLFHYGIISISGRLVVRTVFVYGIMVLLVLAAEKIVKTTKRMKTRSSNK